MSAIRVFGSNEDISKIADILITFASLAPAEDKRSAESNAFATRSWKTLGWALNEEWDGEFLDPLPQHIKVCLLIRYTYIGFITSPDSYRDETAYSEAITRFLAINKFVANLARAGIARYNLYILWTMRTALEYSPEQRMRRDDPEVYVLAAAACVVIAGEKIRSYDDEFPPGELTGRPAEGGPLWEGKHGFCEGRWRLWKKRFWSVAEEHELSEKVKAVAKDAYDEMERIDREV